MAFRVSHGSVELWLSVSGSVLQCVAVWLGIGLTGVKNRRQLYGRDKKVIQSDQDYDDDGDNNMMMIDEIVLHAHIYVYICIQLNLCVSSFSTRID